MHIVYEVHVSQPVGQNKQFPFYRYNPSLQPKHIDISVESHIPQPDKHYIQLLLIRT